MSNLSIRRDDNVIVLSGKDKGKKGKVIASLPKEGKVLVEGINVATRHQKPRRRTDPGGLIHKEIPIYVCKVMRICPKCQKPTRAAHGFLEDGSKSRLCKKCGEMI